MICSTSDFLNFSIGWNHCDIFIYFCSIGFKGWWDRLSPKIDVGHFRKEINRLKNQFIIISLNFNNISVLFLD